MAPGWRAGLISRAGGRTVNEDACGYWSDERGLRACFVLADGAGGHAAGEVAARLAVDAALEACPAEGAATAEGVQRLLNRAQAAVVGRRAAEPALDDMRCTLVVLFIDLEAACASWGHVGDSRLYCLAGGTVLARTRDHSLAEALRLAGFDDSGARVRAEQRNLLVAAIGSEQAFLPTIGAPVPIAGDCAFLLCSDGFWSGVDEPDMLSSLAKAGSPDEWLAALERPLLAAVAPGSDNFSALAVWCGAPNAVATAPRPRAADPAMPGASGTLNSTGGSR